MRRIISVVFTLFILIHTSSFALSAGPGDIIWIEDYYEGLQKAQKENKPVFSLSLYT